MQTFFEAARKVLADNSVWTEEREDGTRRIMRPGGVDGIPASDAEYAEVEAEFAKPEYSAKYSTKQQAQAAVRRIIDQLAAQVTGPVSVSEQVSWPVKAAAAERSLAGMATAEDTAMLQAEIDETGETIDDLANAIVKKAKRYQKISMKLAGLRRKADKRLEKAADASHFEAIVDQAQARADRLMEKWTT